jgi:hypothetical protein
MSIAVGMRHTTSRVGGRHAYLIFIVHDRIYTRVARLMVENVSVRHHLGTYPQYMVVSVYLLEREVVGGLFIGRSSIIYFFLRSENLLSLFSF